MPAASRVYTTPPSPPNDVVFEVTRDGKVRVGPGKVWSQMNAHERREFNAAVERQRVEHQRRNAAAEVDRLKHDLRRSNAEARRDAEERRDRRVERLLAQAARDGRLLRDEVATFRQMFAVDFEAAATRLAGRQPDPMAAQRHRHGSKAVDDFLEADMRERLKLAPGEMLI